MEVLQPFLGSIKIANNSDKVYKDECVFSFDNPETDTGLYVSLSTFIGLGRDYVLDHYNRTGDAVYLHNRRERHELPSEQGDGPEKKITRLAIGIEGGFSTDPGKKYEYTNHYSIVVLPSFAAIPWPNVDLPEIVKLSVESIFNVQSAAQVAELEAATSWDGEHRIISKHAYDLPQQNTGKKIPPSGWKCEQCDKTDNLWLNLSDGSVLCGRKFFDGSGGNNHAAEHYSKTGYPLAVKLGTITKDGKGDVFSYSEDDMVEDPNLISHLSHWGININNMEKTEKSMAELELELNKKNNEWSALTEKDHKLQPLYGPGYTGMANMGNSCYLNSVMQLLFSIPDFNVTYFGNRQNILSQLDGSPAENFNVQMSKVAHGLLSGKYSLPPSKDEDPTGIYPSMFKNLVGRGHPEFSTKRQQDVQEFVLHIFNLMERNARSIGNNPSDCFKFQIEDRFQCGETKKVKYLKRAEVILPLMIPMEAATNKDEVAAYLAQKAELELQGKHIDANLLVRPKIEFTSCLESFAQEETINNFYSAAVNKTVTAKKTTKFATLPDFLLIQLKKFTLRADWVPVKLDVSVPMPEVFDFGSLRGTGQQPGEETLPELETAPQMPEMDEAVIKDLVDKGFPLESCKRAIYFTKNSGLEAATQWILDHIGDADFADPFIPPGMESTKFVPDPESVATIKAIGFSEANAVKALKLTNNNIERAMDWIFSHQDELQGPASPVEPEFRDGESVYKLVAFISHMGTSTSAGHYVVHILKEGRWVIFNDNKVALSENPPKDLGYLYLYERL